MRLNISSQGFSSGEYVGSTRITIPTTRQPSWSHFLKHLPFWNSVSISGSSNSAPTCTDALSQIRISPRNNYQWSRSDHLISAPYLLVSSPVQCSEEQTFRNPTVCSIPHADPWLRDVHAIDSDWLAVSSRVTCRAFRAEHQYKGALLVQFHDECSSLCKEQLWVISRSALNIATFALKVRLINELHTRKWY